MVYLIVVILTHLLMSVSTNHTEKDTVQYSVTRGFYDQPFDLELAFTKFPGTTTIRYSLSRALPTTTAGTAYSGPIRISTTTIVRSIAFNDQGNVTRVNTHTYLFLDSIIAAPYMKPSITQSPTYAPLMREALSDLPSVMLTQETDLEVSDTAAEVPVSIEWFDHADPIKNYQIDGGTVYYGNYGMYGFDKKPRRLYFKSKYGHSKLEYDVFYGTDKYWEKSAMPPVDKFDELLLHSGSADQILYYAGQGWIPPKVNAQLMRNRFSDQIMIDAGNLVPHGRMVNVYENGQYWGLYYLKERFGTKFLASYYGGADDVDYEFINRGQLRDGTGETWNFIKANSNNYEAIKDYLNVPNFVDYMVLQFWMGNTDWGVQWNWQSAGPAKPGNFGGYVMWANDVDLALISKDVDVTSGFGGPDNVWGGLLGQKHPDFMAILYDRIQKLFYNGGVATTEYAQATYLSIAQDVRKTIIAESARWSGPYDWTRDIQFEGGVDFSVNTWFPYRPGKLMQIFQANAMLSPIATPTFSPYGFPGPVDNNAVVSISFPAGTTLYYTLDGTDPRLPGGAPNPNALSSTSTVSLTLTEITNVKARATNGAQWSAVEDQLYLVKSGCTVCGKLIVSEINYDPKKDTPEFIEIKNIADTPLNLAGLTFNGVNYKFPSVYLPAKSFWVLTNDHFLFKSKYGKKAEGIFFGSLSNGGERLTLKDGLDRKVFSIKYDDKFPWSELAANNGYTLVPKDPNQLMASVEADEWKHWRNSASKGGSPWQDDPNSLIPTVFTLTINEIMSSSDSATQSWIEMTNPSDTATVDISGWYLSTTFEDPKFYKIPANTVIPPKGFITLSSDQTGVQIDALGDQIFIFESLNDLLTGTYFQISFGESETGVPTGWYTATDQQRYFLHLAQPTPGATNSGPKLGPFIISEIYYHLPAGYEEWEYISLTNIDKDPHSLIGWAISGVVSITDEVQVVPPNSTVYLARSIQVDKFKTVHGLKKETLVVGGSYREKLNKIENNSTLQIFLTKPSVKNPSTHLTVEWINIDVFGSLVPGAGNKSQGNFLDRNMEAGLLACEASAWERKVTKINYLPTPTPTPVPVVIGESVEFLVNITSTLSTTSVRYAIETIISQTLDLDRGYINVKITNTNPNKPTEAYVKITFDGISSTGKTLSINDQARYATMLEDALKNSRDTQLALNEQGVQVPLIPEVKTPANTPSSKEPISSDSVGAPNNLYIYIGASIGALVLILIVVAIVCIVRGKSTVEERV